jgi:hypothetical protein
MVNIMTVIRCLIVALGVLLPYLCGVLRAVIYGTEVAGPVLDVDVESAIFFGAFNAISWGSIFLTTFTYESTMPVILPAGLGFVFDAYAYTTLDLASDAQAGIALVFIPIYSVPLIAVGWLAGICCDRYLRVRSRNSNNGQVP